MTTDEQAAPKFKTGDRVRVHGDDNPSHGSKQFYLDRKNIYVVSKIIDDFVQLNKTGNLWWISTRFEIVPTEETSNDKSNTAGTKQDASATNGWHDVRDLSVFVSKEMASALDATGVEIRVQARWKR